MNTLERIVDEVKALPEFQAREVLDFVGYLKSRRAAPDILQTSNDDADWAEFEKTGGHLDWQFQQR